MPRSRYDPPSIPSAFQSNRSIQLNENIVIINLHLVVTMIHLIIPFFHRQIQILIQIIIQILLNQILTQEHKVHLQIHNQ